MSNIFPGSVIPGAVRQGCVQGSAFGYLTAQGVQVGSAALPLTCDRDDQRKSIIDGTDVAADVADLRLVNGIFVESSLKGDENLVTPDMTVGAWVKPASVVVTEPSSGVYRMSFDGTGGTPIVLFAIPEAANNRCGQCSARIVSGTPDSLDRIDFRTAGAGTTGTPIDVDNLGSDFSTERFCATTSDTASKFVGIRIKNNTPLVIEIMDMRAVGSTAPSAGYPYQSPVGTDYAKDILTFLRTFTVTATMQFTVTPYGWSDDGNPVDAEAVLFESGALRLKLSAAGFVEIDGTAVSTKKLTANTLSVITVKYDGVNHTLQVDGETPVVVASSIIPSGTSYVGNNAAGTHPSHAVEHVDIYDNKLLTAAEITTGEEGLQARLGSMVLV